MIYKNNAIYFSKLNSNVGLLSDLNLSENEIARMERMGYITTSISPKGRTWKITKKGRLMRDCLSERNTLWVKISDWFFKRILHYNVTI